jgi:hypothetical protein
VNRGRKRQFLRVCCQLIAGMVALALGVLGVRLGLPNNAGAPADIIRTSLGACCSYDGLILIGDLPDTALVLTFQSAMAKPRSRCQIPCSSEAFNAGFEWLFIGLGMHAEKRWLGFKTLRTLDESDRTVGFARQEMGFSLCVPGLLLAVMLSQRAVRSWRGRGQLLCGPCSYDLTGNTSGICPECGTPTSANATP